MISIIIYSRSDMPIYHTEYRPCEIVPQSGIDMITHDPAHADMPHEVTVIKGRRFPTCQHCKEINFELDHAASMSARSTTSRRRMRRRSNLFPLPAWIPPQLTQLVDEAPDGPDWLHEIKFDSLERNPIPSAKPTAESRAMMLPSSSTMKIGR